jgi:hypothetical protein
MRLNLCVAIRQDQNEESWRCRFRINKRGEVSIYIPREMARALQTSPEKWENKTVLVGFVYASGQYIRASFSKK